MANNQLTDEELQTLIIELQQTAYRLNGTNFAYLMSDAIKPLRELQERRKAAMDSEPVAEITEDLGRLFVKIHFPTTLKAGDKLYRHAQPAPEYPEKLPCPVLLEPGLRFGKGIKTSTMLAALARRAVHESDMAALSPEERAEFQAGIEDFKALIAQPAPVVLEVMEPTIEAIKRILPTLNPDEYAACIGADMWNACRAAMLQAQSDDDGEPTDDERIMAIEGIHNCERCGDEGWVVGEMGITRCACNQGNPVFKIDLNSDFIKHVKAVSEKVRSGNSPVIPEGYVIVPKDLLSELRDWAHPEIEKYCELWEGRRDSEFPALRKVIADADALLAAAPQEVSDGK